MKRSELSSRVLTILQRKTGCVILIKGSWGTGKTYFWRNSIEPVLNADKKTAYTSLFGKKDIESIQVEVLAQLFTINRHLKKIQDAIGSVKTDFGFGDKASGTAGFGIAGSALNIVFNLLERNSFNNVTLCIDDFERKASTLKCVEIIGYASILSERHGCSIVLLMDEDKISADEKNEYETYKEKFVDYELVFDVSQEDVIGNILAPLDVAQRENALKAISAARENNLRVILRAAEFVVDISKVVRPEFGDDERGHLSFHVFALVSLYHAFGADGLENISTISLKQLKGEETKPDDLAQILRSRLGHGISKYIGIDVWLWKYITGQAVDIDVLNSILSDYRSDKQSRQFSTRVFELLDMYLYDLQITARVFEEDMVELLKQTPRNIVSVVRYENFRFLIDSIVVISGNASYWIKYETRQLVEYVSLFFDKNSDFDAYSKMISQSNVLQICSYSSAAKIEHDLLLERLSKAAQTHDEIAEAMETVIRNRGWNHHVVECLNGVTSEFIAQGIKESPAFFESLVDFLRWEADFSDPPFIGFTACSFKALDSLGVEQLGKFRYDRVSMLTKRKL